MYSQEIKQKTKELQNQPQIIKKMAIRIYISIITLNVSGLNARTKRHRLAEWIQQDPYICCLQEIHIRPKDTYGLEGERLEKYIPGKWKVKESWSSNPHIRQNRP